MRTQTRSNLGIICFSTRSVKTWRMSERRWNKDLELRKWINLSPHHGRSRCKPNFCLMTHQSLFTTQATYSIKANFLPLCLQRIKAKQNHFCRSIKRIQNFQARHHSWKNVQAMWHTWATNKSSWTSSKLLFQIVNHKLRMVRSQLNSWKLYWKNLISGRLALKVFSRHCKNWKQVRQKSSRLYSFTRSMTLKSSKKRLEKSLKLLSLQI